MNNYSSKRAESPRGGSGLAEFKPPSRLGSWTTLLLLPSMAQNSEISSPIVWERRGGSPRPAILLSVPFPFFRFVLRGPQPHLETRTTFNGHSRGVITDGNRYADRKRRRRKFVVDRFFVMCKVGCETKLNNRYFIVPFRGNPNRQVF